MIKTIQHIQALSAFKQDALNKKIACLGIKLMATEFVHFADGENALSSRQLSVLEKLLSDNPQEFLLSDSNGRA